MSTTKKSDLFVPEVFVDAVKGAFAGMKALWGTPVAVVNGSMPSTNGGDKLKVPYFNTLGELEDLPDDESAGLTPAKLSMSTEEAVVRHSGKAFEITKWAEIAANFADPYAEAARQLVVAVERRADKALIDAAIAGLDASMIHDVYNASTPRTLNYDVLIDGKMKWGDEQQDIALVVVHSKVLGDLYKLKDNSGRPLLSDAVEGGLYKFAGIPVAVSDRLAPTGAKYTTLVLKKGALVYWYNGTPEVDVDKDILANSKVAAIHVYWIAHRYNRLPDHSKGGVVAITHN
jgi:hypothetical protein